MSQSQSLTGLALGTTVTYLLMVAAMRFQSWYKLEHDTPEPRTPDEAYPIYNNLGFVDLPFLATKALEFGFFKTYSIPSISAVLLTSKQLTEDTLRRFDDTDIIVREFLEHRPSSSRAELAIRRLNYLHGRHPISNDDYLYVLCVFVVEPMRWVNAYGYRRVHRLEELSAYIIWKDVGEKMGIQSIPPSFAAMKEYMASYEQRKMRYCRANAKIADATAAMLLGDVPGPLRPLARRVLHAVCDAPLREAMGFPHPPTPLLPLLCHGALLGVGMFTRFLLLPRRRPLHRTPQDTDADAAAASAAAGDGSGSRSVLGVLRCPMFSLYGSHEYQQEGYVIEKLGPRHAVPGDALGAGLGSLCGGGGEAAKEAL